MPRTLVATLLLGLALLLGAGQASAAVTVGSSLRARADLVHAVRFVLYGAADRPPGRPARGHDPERRRHHPLARAGRRRRGWRGCASCSRSRTAAHVAVAESDPQVLQRGHAPGRDVIYEFAAQIPVSEGDLIALDRDRRAGAVFHSYGADASYATATFAPVLGDGPRDPAAARRGPRASAQRRPRARRRPRRPRRRDPGLLPAGPGRHARRAVPAAGGAAAGRHAGRTRHAGRHRGADGHRGRRAGTAHRPVAATAQRGAEGPAHPPPAGRAQRVAPRRPSGARHAASAQRSHAQRPPAAAEGPSHAAPAYGAPAGGARTGAEEAGDPAPPLAGARRAARAQADPPPGPAAAEGPAQPAPRHRTAREAEPAEAAGAAGVRAALLARRAPRRRYAARSSRGMASRSRCGSSATSGSEPSASARSQAASVSLTRSVRASAWA